MKAYGKCLCIFMLIKCVVGAPPVILKESSPSGRSVVVIASSDPNNQNYFASATASQQRSFDKNAGNSVQSFSVAGPGKSIAGTGRSFDTASVNNPFFVPFLVGPNIEGIDLTWLRNLESAYDPKFAGNSGTSITAINDNGHVYGKINNVPFDHGVKSA